jgi:DNA polymerase-3 subunit beta
VKVLRNFRKLLKDKGELCIIMDIPKETGEQVVTDELDQNYKVYYNYLSQDELKAMIEKSGFVIEDTKVVLRLLEGEFVKYNDILPKESSTRVVLNRSDFLESIERASLLAKVGKNNLIRFDIKDHNIEITSKSEEGNVKEEVIVSKEGNDIVIGFNSKYMIDALKVIDDEEISLLFNTAVSPCLIKPLSGNKYEYLVLPVRITNN